MTVDSREWKGRLIIDACIGIWDVMNSEDVIKFVRERIASDVDLGTITEQLCDNCLAKDEDNVGLGCDNMTVMIAAILNGKSENEWLQMIKSNTYVPR